MMTVLQIFVEPKHCLIQFIMVRRLKGGEISFWICWINVEVFKIVSDLFSDKSTH